MKREKQTVTDEDAEIVSFCKKGNADAFEDLVKKYQKKISHFVSQKDQGQTDAINKGFSLARVAGAHRGRREDSNIFQNAKLRYLSFL